MQGGLRLVTAYDLTGLYRDRDAALTRFLLLEAAVLAAAAAVTALLAARLTRPLAVLTDAGQQIAAGDYARRTALHTGDEIETLSASFDKMADAMQEKNCRPGSRRAEAGGLCRGVYPRAENPDDQHHRLRGYPCRDADRPR